MPGPHTELTFETSVVHELTTLSGWRELPADAYDRTLRLVPTDLAEFLSVTQPERVEQLQDRLGDGWLRKTCEYIAKGLKRPGETLKLLRTGKVVHGVAIDLAYFRPTHGKVAANVERYDANVLTVIRQVPYSPDHHNTIDVALFVNGIPVAGAELKNGISQKVADAVHQYRTDRDPKDEFLSRRCVVHFAVDPTAVWMTTQLAGKATRFLQFNRGSAADGQGGAGNWQPEDGSHPTSYLWRDVWQRDSWLDLIQSFIHVEHPDPDDPLADPSLIFPRFHQWDCVLRFVNAARTQGPGENYLAMHSTGSGKTNTIGWLAHRLANLFDDADQKVFDKVIVITDRKVLDRQLQDKVEQFESTSAKGMVRTITESAKELAEALRSPAAKIIVTTIQKFPHIVRDVEERAGSRFAVIIDEAHSSQTGESAGAMKLALSKDAKPTDEQLLDMAAEADAAYDVSDDPAAQMAEQVAAARGPQKNLSMFAFTATPKNRTLELFGTRDADTGQMRPTHLYSMRQAIEEGFIMDVLRNYTTYNVYYRLATDSDHAELLSEEVEKSKALAAARRYASLHPHNIAQKVEVLVEHFREHVQHRIGGRAKAMVVTASRLHAVRYKKTIDKYLAAKGYDDLHTLIAFSGTVFDPDDGEEYSEPGMNEFPEKQTERRFGSDDYQVMVVAEKYQTGFSQPLLHTMYVDKKLVGVNAVQTLSRLNRIHPLKEDTFVLDFVNDIDTIQEAYSDYWGEAIAESTDPQVLYETWEDIDGFNVIEQADVDAFAKVWFDPEFDPRATDAKAGSKAATLNAALFAALRPAEERFAELDETTQESFRQRLRQFVRMYAFLSQIVSYADTDAEKRYAYGRMLSYRIAEEQGKRLDLDDELRMTHYRIEKAHEGEVVAGEGGTLAPTFPGGGMGPLTEEEQVVLSEVIERINDRYGQNLTESHKLLVASVYEKMTDDTDLQQKAGNNPKEKFLLSAKPRFEAALFENLDDHTDLVKAFIENPQMQEMLITAGLDFVYRRAAEKWREAEAIGESAAS